MNKIRNLGMAVLLAGASLLASMPAQAQNLTAKTDPTDYFAAIGTAVSTNVSYAIAPARGGAKGRIELISAKSDSSGASLKIYTVTADLLVTNALASGLSNVLVSATNGLALGDVVILRSVANDTYQKCLVGPALTASGFVITNDLTAATTSFALAAGDHVYRCTSASIPIGATRTDFNGSGGGVWYSQSGYPALLEVTTVGSATNSTNNTIVISGRFVR